MLLEERRLRITGVMERVPAACAFVVEAARHAGLDERAINHCQLAVDEACTNVVEHGYHQKTADQTIDIICRHELEAFSIIVVDDSPAFDPLSTLEPNPDMPLEAREPGGWGIYFIKRVMDEVLYHYDGERNHLVMVKHIGQISEAYHLQHTPNLISVASVASDIWVMLPHGQLDSRLSPMFEQVIHEHVDAGHRYFVIDLKNVNYVSSSGMKALIALVHRVRALDGNMVLASVYVDVREVFEMLGLDALFTIYDTIEDAALHMKGSG